MWKCLSQGLLRINPDRPDSISNVCQSILGFMMMVGAIGQGAALPQYFGIVERFSVFAAVGFNAVLGVYLFKGFRER